MGSNPATQSNGGLLEQVIEQQSPSLLDQIIAKQAEVASRYQPVMSPADAVKRSVAIKELKDLVLKEGEDYGVIPGTNKPTLLKPGAEKINAFFGYVPDYSLMPGSMEDWKGDKYGEPLFYYHIKCTLLKDGAPVGQGTGSCNSWESKYRYRQAKRKCPSCGGDFIIAGKAEYGGGWLCFVKKGGCGTKFAAGDQSIEGQQVGQVANPDFADTINTVQKMADKRAYIAATLSATGASQWFTQDMEDMSEPVDTGGHPMNTREAQEHVRDQKIAQARKASPAPQASAGDTGSTQPSSQGQKGQNAPRDTGAEPRKEAAPVTDPLALALATAEKEFLACDKYGKLKAFTELKKDIEEITGGDLPYYEILAKHVPKEKWRDGQPHADGFVKLGDAKAAFRELWLYLAEVSAAVNTPPEETGGKMSADAFVEGLEPEVANAGN